MKRLLFFACYFMLAIAACAETITVKNLQELKQANKNAKQGDIILLQNGEWSDVDISLDCVGTSERPITFKAQTVGQVKIIGNSKLRLGGSFIIIDGLYFTNGFAGSNAVIDFRINKDKLANDCRITNCVINDFNNPKRMDENYWVSLSGKRNRIDHCTFQGKKNMGVLMAVILDDDRSRENFHKVDHNYFGTRLPLASNSGEIIRIGLSQHCEFNSNTQITDNFFEHCDGETEIISIKSCSNIVRNNLFKECQGGVVLRHGNYNTVENNIFLGNGKEGTGGVRIINKGQWVVNNLFYKCRGTGFRSPLSVMNGVPNSPAFRYVAVTDAVVANNSFVDCTPISLCEGSDTERSVTPNRVSFQNNIFYNTKDVKIYHAYDDISGISFMTNVVDAYIKQPLAKGFIKSNISSTVANGIVFPAVSLQSRFNDSLITESKQRMAGQLSNEAGYKDAKRFAAIKNNAMNDCGALWFKKINNNRYVKPRVLEANDGASLTAALSTKSSMPLIIKLAGNSYQFDNPILIEGEVSLASSSSNAIKFISSSSPYMFQIKGGSSLALNNMHINLSDMKADKFITSDVNGSSGHSELVIKHCDITDATCDVFYAAKSTMLDSVIISNSSFSNIHGTVFNFNNEDDKKGYYNVEHLKINDCKFSNIHGQLLGLLRGGNDESTMGPLLQFTNNVISEASSPDVALIRLNGTQRSFITGNTFKNAAKGNTLLEYIDAVRAMHVLSKNECNQAGAIVKNKFVEIADNKGF